MATNATVSLTTSGNVTLTGAVGLLTPSETLVFGQGNWAAMALSLSYGTGNNQIKNLWFQQRTITAGLNDDLDLAGSLANDFDAGIVFTAIKLLLVSIVAPDGTKRLKVGPQGVANAFPGKWGGVTALFYDEIYNFNAVINHPWAGYPVTAGTADILRINNPTAGAVTYNILIAGVTP
jgi:hypothetical protein